MYVCTVALLIGSICPNADLALLSLQISLLPIRYRRPMVDLEHNVDYGCFVLRTLDCTTCVGRGTYGHRLGSIVAE